MKLVPVAFVSIIMCATAAAQVPDVSISVTGDNEHPMIVVSNEHNAAIEAFIMSVDTSGAARPLTRIYYDVYANYKHDVRIPPGLSQQVPLPRIAGQELPIPTLLGVVFSDGTNEGDASSVQELLHRRRILEDRLEEVMSLLQNISKQNLSREDALDAVHKAWKARTDATPDATPQERVWHNQIFYMAIRNLQDNPRGNGKTPDLALVLKTLNRALANWLSDLQASKPSLALHPGPSN